MRRRGFLGALGAAIAGATLDPERALWVPGARVISVPAPAPIGLALQFIRDYDCTNKRIRCFVQTGPLLLAGGVRNFGVEWEYVDFLHPERAAAIEVEARRQLESKVSTALGRPVRFTKETRRDLV